MHASRFTGLIVLLLLLGFATPQAGAAVVGAGEANAQGACLIEFPVNPELEPMAVVEQLSDFIQLSGSATVKEITVEDGQAQVECADAAPGSVVEASLPDDVYALLAPEAPPGIHPGAIVGGALIGATGVGLGAAAAGAFDGDDRLPMTSPNR